SAAAARAAAARPDLAASLVRVRESEAARSLARAQLIPEPGLALVYQPDEPFASGLRFAPAISFSVPLFNFFGGERSRAAAGLRQARVMLDQARAGVHADVDLALADFHAAEARVARYGGGLLQQAATARDDVAYAYRSGAASLLDVLDAMRAYAETRVDYATAVHDYWVASWAVDRATAQDIALP
ncbi:MAG: TolC family protein, partial [Burkholderiales bacterium]|nr:TolC family protein [Burkholderiales bacterium]